MKTNRYEIAFLLAVCVLSLFALACDGTPTSCTNSTRTQGNDEFKRWVAVVSKNGAAVADNCWHPLAKNDELSTDSSGEAELNFSYCWDGRIYIFNDSYGNFQVAGCRKADFGTIGDCVLGTWYYGTCAGEFTIHTGSASIVKNGTSLSVTYVPERELTLVVVLEGRVWVTPVDSFGPTVLGQAQIVSAPPSDATFYFTMPKGDPSKVGGLKPRQVYPVALLPAVVSQLGIHDWMLKVSEKATRDRVLPPTWPKELGGFGKQFRVGLVTDVGKVNDGTFNEFAYKGMMQAVDEMGLTTAFIETLAVTDYEKNIEQFAKEGYDMIVTVGFMINDATTAMAKKYPNIKFAGVDESSDQPNFAGLTFSEDQSGFLAGCLAGLMTKSNVVGIVAGMEIPPVIKFRLGYENGAMYVNPYVKVLGVYIDSFTDPARGKEAALSQIAEKADVIFGAGGPTGSGGIMGAAAQGVWVIGVDQDEYLTTFGKGSVAGANKLLSSAMKRVDVAVYTAIKNAAMDTWASGNVLFEAKNDGVGLAPYHDTESAIPQAVKDKLSQIAADMKAGKIESGVKL